MRAGVEGWENAHSNTAMHFSFSTHTHTTIYTSVYGPQRHNFKLMHAYDDNIHYIALKSHYNFL